MFSATFITSGSFCSPCSVLQFDFSLCVALILKQQHRQVNIIVSITVTGTDAATAMPTEITDGLILHVSARNTFPE